MRNKIIVIILRQLYVEFLRDLVIDKVAATETLRDDRIVDLLDQLLDYNRLVRKEG